MRYAIISDIHSNLEALESALNDIRRNEIEKIICCGDIVGYGPNPKECIDMIRGQKNAVVIMGNHDAALAGIIDLSNFNENAKSAININRKQLNEDEVSYLASLPKTYYDENIQFVHGSLRDPLNEYLKTLKALQENINLMQGEILFCGHTHYPKVYSKDKQEKYSMEDLDTVECINIHGEGKYIVDVGSIGQPRDEDNRSCFVYYDSSNTTIKYIRMLYDIKKVQDKMSKLAMPEELISRLATGR